MRFLSQVNYRQLRVVHGYANLLLYRQSSCKKKKINNSFSRSKGLSNCFAVPKDFSVHDLPPHFHVIHSRLTLLEGSISQRSLQNLVFFSFFLLHRDQSHCFYCQTIVHFESYEIEGDISNKILIGLSNNLYIILFVTLPNITFIYIIE